MSAITEAKKNLREDRKNIEIKVKDFEKVLETFWKHKYCEETRKLIEGDIKCWNREVKSINKAINALTGVSKRSE